MSSQTVVVRYALVLFCLLLCLAFPPTAAPPTFAQGMQNMAGMAEGRLMRFPDVHGDKIVFMYGGDLWLVSTQGGVARRLTTSPGLELFPHFSPDGKWIAFTGQYDGNFNVYVMPSEGGEPRQLTFLPDIQPMPERMGPNNEVITWTPDSKSIVFLSRRNTFNDWFGRLFTVPVEGGLPVQLPIDKGGLTSFSPDGKRIAYNRIFRNFRTWKRYTGGMAQSIWIYDFAANHEEKITDWEGTNTYPMWRGDTIFFGSDRGTDHRVNLYDYDLKSKQTRQLTHFADYDVDWPSLGGDQIVFENAGYLYLYDIASGKEHKLTIDLPGDRDQARRRWTDVSSLVTDFDIAPDGNRAVIAARGDVFTVPAKHGSIRNLTSTPGIREQGVAWSPDGKWIAYLSDRTGEQEIYLMPQDGMGKEVRVTSDGKVFRFPPEWSPDSKKLLFADKDLRLYYVDIEAKKPVLIDQAKYAEINDYAWSSDSNWVAYSKQDFNTNRFIELYSLATGKITSVTDSFTSSANPVFDPGGKYLYFISARDYNEVLGVYDAEFSNPKAIRVYAVTLSASEPSPFAPQSDEVAIKSEVAGASAGAGTAQTESKKSPEDEKKSAAENKPMKVDLDGIENRVVALPIPPGVITQLGAAKDEVIYLSQPISGLSGPLPGEASAIHVFDLKGREDKVLLTPANGFAVSADGKKLLYAADNHQFGILDTTPPGSPHHPGDSALDLSGMKLEVDPKAEWKEMFDEVWRQERDYFFEASMNGVDWAKVRDKYAVLLPYVADRYDLTLLLGDMIGELSNSHTYVGGGDLPDLHPVNVGLLGVDFEADKASGFYRIKKIYPGQNWDARRRSPLTEPGVQVSEGSYLLAVNGHALRVPQNPYELFVNTAGQNVTLAVNAQPSETGAHNVVVQPVSSEFHLRELDWIDTNRKKVDAATKGKVGYVYIPDMGADGLNEFVRQFFPQIRKEGLIFDVRYNGGGFVDQIILERLRRVLAGMSSARNFAPSPVNDPVFNGSMACITNEYAASDGDFFTYFFKWYKLGPVIGMRTWGGVRGIRGEIPLMDGGYITRPEFALYDLNSQWLIENHGVEPDIVVDNLPSEVMAGHDPQLEKAIEVVMKDIQEHPRKLPPVPPDLPAYPPKKRGY